MLIALISDNIVAAIVTVHSDEEYASVVYGYQNGIDITDANPQPQVGWIFDGLTMSPPEGQAVPTRKITRLGLRRRFTFSELIAIKTASASIPAVAVLLDNLTVSTYVDLNRADTAGGLALLVSVGLITSDRASQILNNPIQDDEKYRGLE